MISTRSMELLRAWGLEEETLAGGVDADVWLWECPTLARAAEGTAHAVGYPTREQAAVVSPCAPGTVPQDWLEAVLRRHVGALPAPGSSSAPSWSGSRTRPTGSAPRCATATAGAATCGPATSSGPTGGTAVRRLLGVGMEEHERCARRCQVVFRAPSGRCSKTSATRSTSSPPPARPVVPPGRAGRPLGLRTVVALRGRRATQLDPGRLAALTRAGSGIVDLDPVIERIGPFLSPGEVADRFRVVACSWRATPRTGSRRGRHRHEYRAAERLRPRLEDGVGAAGGYTALLYTYEKPACPWCEITWSAPPDRDGKPAAAGCRREP